MRKKEDNLEKKRNLQRKVWKKLLAFTCVVSLGIADIGTASAMGASTAGTSMTAGMSMTAEQGAGALMDSKDAQETESGLGTKKLQETESKSETERQESEREPETKDAQETERESETKEAQETESESETKEAQETESESETKEAQETERESETKEAQETESESETKEAQETESESETKEAQETERESETKEAQETESESETKEAQETEREPETKESQGPENESKTDKPQETETSSEIHGSQETTASSETKESVAAAPGEPVLKSVTSFENSVTIEWEAVDGAEGYRVYRKTSGSSWGRIAEVNAEITSWKDTGLIGGEYIYTVRAFVKDQNQYLLSSYNKQGVSVKVIAAPAEPVLKSAASSSYNSVKVNWGAADGAEGYRVYRKTSGTSWKRIAEVDAGITSWKDTGLTCGQEYIYTVRAFVKDQDKYLLSTYSKKGITAIPVPAAPSLDSMVSEASSVTINWKKVSGVTCYYVYRKEPGGKWKRIASVDKETTSYQDKKASKGIRYIYTVKGMHNDIKGKYNSKGIEGAVQVQSITLKSISISSGGTAKIKWEKRSGADGYYVYRKESGGKWKRLKEVSAETSSWSEKGLESDGEYIYTVVGYMTLNGKAVKGCVNSKGIAPKLEYTGNFVRNVTKTYLGTSGEGRQMYSYTIGSGNNHIVITMAIHGWEDEWNKDGAALVKTGEQLIRTAAGKTSALKENDYSIIIIPMGNPDGLYSGTTCNGPGRCTTYRYNNDGKLVKGGVDLNRCFPTGFSAQYGTRNYTGDKPLMAKEAAILKKFVDSNKGSGKNIFIDAHGWYNQTITPKSGSGSVYNSFKKYFSGTRAASLGKGYGYISAYANSKGYDSVLFEFPNVSSESSFTKNGYANKYINTILYMVKNIK